MKGKLTYLGIILLAMMLAIPACSVNLSTTPMYTPVPTVTLVPTATAVPPTPVPTTVLQLPGTEQNCNDPNYTIRCFRLSGTLDAPLALGTVYYEGTSITGIRASTAVSDQDAIVAASDFVIAAATLGGWNLDDLKCVTKVIQDGSYHVCSTIEAKPTWGRDGTWLEVIFELSGSELHLLP